MTPTAMIFQSAIRTFYPGACFLAFGFMGQKLELFTPTWIVVDQWDVS